MLFICIPVFVFFYADLNGVGIGFECCIFGSSSDSAAIFFFCASSKWLALFWFSQIDTCAQAERRFPSSGQTWMKEGRKPENLCEEVPHQVPTDFEARLNIERISGGLILNLARHIRARMIYLCIRLCDNPCADVNCIQNLTLWLSFSVRS